MSAGSVLIVQQDPRIRFILEMQLRDAGFDIAQTLDTAERALSFLETEKPDIILSGIAMNGDLDGLELCRRVRANESSKHIPILILSVMNRATDVARGLEAGANDYIFKPWETTDLTSRIARLIQMV
jgi:DNA-binding response OmpR family regulator